MDTFAEIYATKLFDRVRRINSKFQEKILPFDINILISSIRFEIDSNEQNQSRNIYGENYKIQLIYVFILQIIQ